MLNCASGPRFRVRSSSWKTDRGAFWRWLVVFLSHQSTQSRHTIAAPAGLLAEAAGVSRSASARPPAQYAGARRNRHLSADRRAQKVTAGGLLDSEELRWRRRRHSYNPTGAEASKNLPTARLLDGIEASPPQSLDYICKLAQQLKIYKECIPYYPFVLGAQPVRPLDLASFLCHDRERRCSPDPLCDRQDHPGRKDSLSARESLRRGKHG